MATSTELHHIDLCSGTGMLGIALKLVFGPRLRTVCYVERESYAASDLVARMEDQALDQAPIWSDVRTFNGRPWRGLMEILSAGYPCQPFSSVGKRLGGRDPRHLWPDIARIVGEAQPGVVFLENVEGHLSLGFEKVCQDLQALGYRVTAGLYAASEVGASHQRKRLFILGYNDKIRRAITSGEIGRAGVWFPGSQRLDVADAGRVRLGEREQRQSLPRYRVDGQKRVADTHGGEHVAKSETPRRQPAAGASDGAVADSSQQGLSGTGKHGLPVCQPKNEGEEGASTCGVHGTPIHLFAPGPKELREWSDIIALDPTLEPAICRMADGMAHRVDRIRLCGNGVVPLAAAYAFVSLFARIFIDEGGTRMIERPSAKSKRCVGVKAYLAKPIHYTPCLGAVA